MNINEYVENDSLRIIVKPNSPKNEILGFDENRNALRVAINAAPDKNKANKEVIKFFQKLTKKKVEIKKGMKSREKLLYFY